MTSYKEITKELCIDIIAIGYSISNTALYWSLAMKFVGFFYNNPEKQNSELHKSPESITIDILMVVFFLSCFCTFSENNETLFKQNFTSKWSNFKKRMRQILGIPSAVIKSLIGGASLFLITAKKMNIWGSASLAILSSIVGFPSQLSLLAAKFTKKNETKTQERVPLLDNKKKNPPPEKKAVKYSLIHISNLLYALSNTAVYYDSLITLPKELGFMNHDLGEKDNTGEAAAYYTVCLLALISLISTHIAYAHLNENLVGLTATESSTWAKVKNYLKKATGGVTAATRTIDASAENFLLFKAKLNIEEDVALTLFTGISGLLTQLSILYFDPLKEEKVENVTDQAIETEIKNEGKFSIEKDGLIN